MRSTFESVWKSPIILIEQYLHYRLQLDQKLDKGETDCKNICTNTVLEFSTNTLFNLAWWPYYFSVHFSSAFVSLSNVACSQKKNTCRNPAMGSVNNTIFLEGAKVLHLLVSAYSILAHCPIFYWNTSWHQVLCHIFSLFLFCVSCSLHLSSVVFFQKTLFHEQHSTQNGPFSISHVESRTCFFTSHYSECSIPDVSVGRSCAYK